MKIYISGKITGDKDYKEKFRKAAVKYGTEDNIILNPAELPEGLYPWDYMRINTAMIDVSDLIVFLEDWEDSDGAKLEHMYCKYTRKKFIFDREVKK